MYILRSKLLKIGALSLKESQARRPLLVASQRRAKKISPPSATMMIYQKAAKKLTIASRISVVIGRVLPKSLYILETCGIKVTSMKITTATITARTIAG